MLIDTHCHIYLPEFEADRVEMIARAENEGVSSFIMPAIDQKTYEVMMGLEELFPSKCMAMMGLHPCSVNAGFIQELTIVEKYLEKRDFAAIGETGLDFFWDHSFSGEQYQAFQRQIELALQYNLPVVIHSRNSIDECISMIKKNQKGDLKGVFHCFSGTIEQAKHIIDLGFYLGIGGVVTFKNSGLDKVMREVDMQHVILETDAPYLAPVPYRGKRNECSYLKYVVEKLSELKGASKKEVEEITTANTKKLFRIQ
jgi:TatD DNase family protein